MTETVAAGEMREVVKTNTTVDIVCVHVPPPVLLRGMWWLRGRDGGRSSALN